MKERCFGIICEFNPFHNGHKRLIDEARVRGARRVVCAMSGNAVQRGELAVIDKYTRAKAAVLCGADLVVELPYPWCAASAEFFAATGVKVLSEFCDTVIFGSESGNLELLKAAAREALKADFKDELGKRLAAGEGSASAYFSMLSGRIGVSLSSNDILGVEYIKAAMQQSIPLSFQTVKRVGAAYNDEQISDRELPSATAIRNLWSEGKSTAEHIPERAYELFCERIILGERADVKAISRALLMYFRLSDPNELSKFADTDSGIAYRIVSAARAATNENEFFDKISTKRYTDAKLRRAVLFSATMVTRELLNSSPFYTTLLATNEEGRRILSDIRRNANINIVTKPADAPRKNGQFTANERLEAIFTLATEKAHGAYADFQKSAFIK